MTNGRARMTLAASAAAIAALMAITAPPAPSRAAHSEGDYVLEAAPADRPRENRPRRPGEFKRNKYGMIDPTPDVISLEFLPKDAYGFVDWSRALRDGVIKPRESINAKAPAEETFDKDILIRSKLKFMPDVIFPHAAHNAWLKCSVCHPRIFKPVAGGNDISMNAIWRGQFCGRCHDKVAFPIRNCFKCHSVPRKGAAGKASTQPAKGR